MNTQRSNLYLENLRRAQAAVADSDFDALVLASPVNVTYTSGVHLHTQVAIPERLAVVVVTADGETTMLIADIEENLTRRESVISDIRVYVEFAISPINAIADILEEKGLTKGRIGVEDRFLVARYMRELEGVLPGAQLASADALMDRVRALKSTYELEVIERACKVTEEVMYEGFAAFRLGESEEDLAWHFRQGFRSRGITVSLLTVVAGEFTEIPHSPPHSDPIAEGSMIKVDMGGLFDHYTSDMARLAYVRPMKEGQIERYHAFVDAYEETLQAITPGITAAELFEASKRAHQRRQLDYSIPHLGHSIGIGLHDEPLLHPKNDLMIEENMVLAVEPRSLLAPGERAHIEDIVLVTADGYKAFTDLGRLRTTFEIG